MRLNFPWWYPWVKWVVPLSLAALSSLIFGLTVTSAINAYGFIQWLPQFYASLEGISAGLFFLSTIGIAASVSLVLTSLCARVVLFHLNEELAVNLKYRAEQLERELRDTKEALDYTEDQRKMITTKYDWLREEKAASAKQIVTEESKEAVNTPKLGL